MMIFFFFFFFFAYAQESVDDDTLSHKGPVRAIRSLRKGRREPLPLHEVPGRDLEHEGHDLLEVVPEQRVVQVKGQDFGGKPGGIGGKLAQKGVDDGAVMGNREETKGSREKGQRIPRNPRPTSFFHFSFFSFFFGKFFFEKKKKDDHCKFFFFPFYFHSY